MHSMHVFRQLTLLLAILALLPAGSSGFDDTPSKSDTPKKDKDAKATKDEPEFNQPPKGAILLSMNSLKGRITKGSDGRTFSVELVVNGKKKEIEINLAASTKVRVIKQSDFDDKGNPKKGARVMTSGTLDDIRGGMLVTVTLNGTRDGAWLVAKSVTITGE
jgi:hypothetical protein